MRNTSEADEIRPKPIKRLSPDRVEVIIGGAALLFLVGYVAGSRQWHLLGRAGAQIVEGLGSLVLHELSQNIKQQL